MRAFTPYKKELYNHLKHKIIDNSSESIINTSNYINYKLRELIDLSDMRESGTFFTSDSMADDLVKSIKLINKESVILDPTCGTGNLLIAVSKKLPVEKTLSKTLYKWNKHLIGFDLFEEFVDATKLRIILEAINRKCRSDLESITEYMDLLTNIKQGNIFNNKDSLSKATHIIMNPPFTYKKYEQNLLWGSGKVNSAAVFFEFCLNNANINTNIYAILPEVLRSGTNYLKWREIVSKYLSADIQVFGRFDNKTNVDVFLLFGEKNNNSNLVFYKNIHKNVSTLVDYFDIKIGPVVQYRDKENGILSPFITPRMINSNSIVNIDNYLHERKYSCKLYYPPFLVVKRTSAPSDKIRAKSTIILGNKPVLVDNHFIIIKSKKDDINDYHKLLELLISNETTQFLNKNIRCRHLTAHIIKMIPTRGVF